MDGENQGKPYEQMDDLGGFPPIFGNTQYGLESRKMKEPCFFYEKVRPC